MEEKTYRLSEASQLTGYARGTLRKLINSGALRAEIKPVPWGGQFREEYRIYASSLEPYIGQTAAEIKVQNNTKSDVEKRLTQLEIECKRLNVEIKRIKNSIQCAE